LSVKGKFGGPARYVSDGCREFIVDDSCYVILNEGNAYTVSKRSPTIVETFCIFFPAGMSAMVARDLTCSDTQLLESPTSAVADTLAARGTAVGAFETLSLRDRRKRRL
jgi:hypothetical protein